MSDQIPWVWSRQAGPGFCRKAYALSLLHSDSFARTSMFSCPCGQAAQKEQYSFFPHS